MLDQFHTQDGLQGKELCSAPVDGQKGNEDVNMGKNCDAGHHHGFNIKKHRKNYECCPVSLSLLIVRSQRLSWIQVLNWIVINVSKATTL